MVQSVKLSLVSHAPHCLVQCSIVGRRRLVRNLAPKRVMCADQVRSSVGVAASLQHCLLYCLRRHADYFVVHTLHMPCAARQTVGDYAWAAFPMHDVFVILPAPDAGRPVESNCSCYYRVKAGLKPLQKTSPLLSEGST